MTDVTAWAERRVMAILLTYPELKVDLEANDFEYEWHRLLYVNRCPEIALMDVPDEVKAYALDLDENEAPELLGAFVRIVKRKSAQRQFAEGVSRLRK